MGHSRHSRHTDQAVDSTSGLEQTRFGRYKFAAGVVFVTLVRLIAVLEGIIPWALEPAWPGLIAAAVTGFLSFEGFHFAGKLPPKG